MKKAFKYCFLIMALCSPCFGFMPIGTVVPIVKNNSDGPTSSVERKLKRDAARLALRTLKKKEVLDDLPIEIPAQLSEGFYKILFDLYSTYPTARSLEECNVHTFPDPAIDHFVIIYDYAAAWAKPLQEGKKETSYAAFQNLLKKHSLKIENHFKWDKTHGSIAIRADKPLNAAAMAEEFLKLDGIVEADLSVPRTQGNDIVAKKITGGWEITYLMQFGAHSQTGAKKHTWRYHYLDSGEIKFMGETGDAVPDWMACAR